MGLFQPLNGKICILTRITQVHFPPPNNENPHRVHFAKFVEGLSAKNCEKAQLGLGHSYSRCKVKFNVHRVDNMIIQSIALLDQIDKDINTFSMRLRWELQLVI